MMLASIVGCSGSVGSAGMTNGSTAGMAKGSTTDPAVNSSSDEDEREAAKRAALERLRMRQEASCKRAGEVLFACAVEDARASMSPEEFIALDVTALEPRYKSEFMARCMDSEMSLRQVEVYEGCLADTVCAVFVPCLDQAQPQRP